MRLLSTNRAKNNATPPRAWYGFRNLTDKTVDLSIMDEIGGWGVSAQQFVNELREIDEKVRIKLHLFSPGGDVLDGFEIYNGLRAHKGGVDVTVGAMCASIATLIACAGDKVEMVKNGLFMIHNPYTFAYGGSDDLRRLAGVMDKMKANVVTAYKRVTGLSDEELGKLMDDETWMTAEEAKAKNFIHTVLDIEDDDAKTVKDRFDLGRFRNCVAALSRIAPNKPEVKPPVESGNTNQPVPPGKPKQRKSISAASTIISDYMNGKTSIFNSIILMGAICPPRLNFLMDPPDDDHGSGATTEEETAKKIKSAAKTLYEAKLKRDTEIDDIVLAVRKRDKKDFSELATKFKKEDKSPDAFARAITTSDDFKPHEVIGSGVEVVAEYGLVKGTPGELFVASAEYRALRDRMAKGSKEGASVMVQTSGFIEAAMNRFLNVTATTGLTSIEKLPQLIQLGVRPLVVKDLISPGATNNTSIRYIRETSFTNAATTVAEGAAKPAASFALEEVDAPVKKIAAYTKVTDELFADFLAVASYINMRLPYMVERTEEDELLNGDGTGTHLTGILATSGIQTQALGALTRPDALYKAMTKVRWGNLAGTAQGGFEPDGIVMHPTDWEVLRLLKDGNNQYYGGGPFTGAYGNGSVSQFEMIWGKPVVITPAIAQGTALVGAFRLSSQYFQRQGLTLQSTNTDQDDFIKNLTTIRAELRLALAVYLPLGFCQVTGL